MKHFIFTLLALLVGCTAAASDARVIIDKGEFVQLNSAGAHAGGYQSVTLPHQWRHADPNAALWRAHYVFDVPDALSSLSKPAIYIPRWAQNARIIFNGRVVSHKGELGAQALSRFWNRPQLVVLPKSAVKDRGNQLELELQTLYVGFLSRLFVDEYEALEPLYQSRLTWQVSLSEGLLAMTLVMAIFLLFLWVQNPAQRQNLYAGLASACWSIHLYGLLETTMPLSDRLWWWLNHTAIDGVTLFLVLFCNRFRGASANRWERALAVIVIVASGCYALVPIQHLIALSVLVHSAGVFVIFAVALVQLRFGLSSAAPQQVLLSAALLILVAFFVHDAYLHSPWGVLLGESRVNLAALGAPLVLLVISWNLAVRFTDEMARAEYLSANLTTEMDAYRKQIIDEFETLSQQKVEAEKAAVRRGIYTYLHHEISEKLLALLHTSRTEEQEHLARLAIEELGEAVRIAAPESDNRLDLVLNDCFAEATRRCDEYLIPLTWHQTLPPELVTLDANLTSGVRRLLREALSNVFKHARASAVSVDVVVTATELGIVITDDGCGMREINPQNGIASLESRVASFNGVFTIESAAGKGTCIKMSLPMQVSA